MTHLRQVREIFTATSKLLEPRMLNKTPDIEKYVNIKIKYSSYIFVNHWFHIYSYYSEFQETDGQLLTLTSQAKVDVSEMDNRSLSPTPDLSLDSPDMPPSIEILQILLDDWSKVVKSLRQKLSDVAGAQPVTDIYTNGQEDFFDYACATCHLVQSAMRSVKYCYYVHEL